MAADGSYALRVPISLMDDLRRAAERDGVSLNGFIVQAVAEKVAALRSRGLLDDLPPGEQAAYLAARAERAGGVGLSDLIAKAGRTDVVVPGDELPEGWAARRT